MLLKPPNTQPESTMKGTSRQEAYKVNELSFTSIDPVSVTVRNLSVSSSAKASSFSIFKKLSQHKTKPKAKDRQQQDIEKQDSYEQGRQILHPTSFTLPHGSLMAIIGGSGSGKTTLLNVLAQRSSSKSSLITNGDVRYNDSTELSSVGSAYVIQQDILSPQLSTRETLAYAAELRLPATVPSSQRRNLVEEVILELGLKDCADTIVGDTTHKGLSGGEKRRLSIGIQILSNPSLLFLDEPTTGLDANSAYLVIKTLKAFSKRGRTIIISIHQPREDIFFLFDYLCLLSKGHTVYNGKVSEVLVYFKSLGYVVPDGVNPADFLIDLSAVDTRSKCVEEEGLVRLQRFVQHWQEYQSHQLSSHHQGKEIKEPVHQSKDSQTTTTTSTSTSTTMIKAPLSREIAVQIRRNLLLTRRDTITLLSLIFESVLMGLICGWVFYKPGGSLSGIRTIQGAIYSANGLQGYLMLLFETYRLTNQDIKLFDREYADGCVSVFGFLISRRISKLFTEDIPVTIIFSSITYFMFGLTPTGSQFFIYYSIILLNHLSSMTCAMLCTALSRNFAQASLIANMNYTLQSFACGFFINARTMPVYVRWLKYVAYVWYGFGAMISNQFTGFYGDCPYSADSTQENGLCAAYDGDYIIKELGYWRHWITLPVCVLLCWAVGMYVVAAGFLKWKRVDVSLSKQVKNVKNQEDEQQEQDNNDREKEPKDLYQADHNNQTDDMKIDVHLTNINLSVRLKHALKQQKTKDKLILQKIDATFRSGSINAIMGPSGSGKSSLLSLISGRLSSSLTNRYHSAGEIYFNDLKIDPHAMHSICSFVSQEDDHLLSTLSVFETLSLSADVRLSRCSKSERLQKVNEIILRLGLKNCADTLIGSEFIKGISGGEKRRVAIGIQLLNNPKVLFLDEPTSGLDSFTSSSILEILQSLCDAGKTIILTIHQPRSDLFSQFGQILLLAKGGQVAYNGPQRKMQSYFEELGYPCPHLTNIADHILDLISVNNQNLENELKSKQRIQLLLDNWHQVKPEVVSSTRTLLSQSEFRSQFHQFIRIKSHFLPAYYASLTQMTLSILRDKQILIARFTNILGIGIILMLFSAPLKNDFIGITNRLGIIQQVASLYFCGMLNNLTSYPMQRDFFYHEYDDGVYGSLPFFLSYLTIEIPFEIISCMIFSCFTGLVVGFPRTFPFFISLSYVAWMICLCGESLGIITNTLFSNSGFAINAVSIVLSIGTFMAGIMSLNMGGFLRGVNYISPLKYSLSIILNMAFTEDVKFTCDPSSSTSTNGDQVNCILNNGEDVLIQYGLKVENYKVYFGVLFVIAVVYRAIAFALLRVKLMRFDLGSLGPSEKKLT